MERVNLSKYAPNFDLFIAIIYCHERIASIAERDADADKTASYLIRLLKFIRDNVIVVRLTVLNEVNAFRVFETLNDRGLDLSAVDLLKNYLFGLAHDHSPQMLSQIEKRWAQITQTLANLKQDDFMKVFWTSRSGRTQLDSIYDDVKVKYRTGEAANNLSIDLLEGAEQFAALDVPDDPVWANHSPKTRVILSSLSIIGSKQARPVILSALKKFTPDEFERLMWLLELVVVRYQLIGEGRTGALEIRCAKLAPLIWSGPVTTAIAAEEVLKDISLSDEAFQDAFRQKEDLSSQKAQYILRKIEDHERSKQNKADVELTPLKNLTIEHILPKDPSSEWSAVVSVDPQIVTDCVLRLGNLCLLTEGSNRSLGRSSLNDKKKVYANSDLWTTRMIKDTADWSRKEIEHRQAWMAKQAVAIWRFQ